MSFWKSRSYLSTQWESNYRYCSHLIS